MTRLFYEMPENVSYIWAKWKNWDLWLHLFRKYQKHPVVCNDWLYSLSATHRTK